ncbi:MAG: AbrB family transcriptional regulator [Pseudomonadota bacterium]
MRERAITFGIAGLGAGAFWAAGLPLPFLLGPLFACLAAALAGVRLKGAGPVSTAMRTVLGVAAGAAITPQLIGRLGDFAASLALVPVFVLLIIGIGYPYFRRICGFDRVTAYYAAAPGGLQDMILFGQEAGGDVRALSLVHATRVLVIVAIMPALLTAAWGVALDQPPGAPVSETPWIEILIMLACAGIGWKGGERIGLFGAAILGPLALSALASLTDFLHGRPPAEAIIAAQFFIGIGIGVNYVGVTAHELRNIVLAATGFCLVLAALAVGFAALVAGIGAAPLVEAALAFAPGGQGEMILLAIIAGADIAYVVTIHMARVIIVILGAPLVAMRVGAEKPAEKPGGERAAGDAPGRTPK